MTVQGTGAMFMVRVMRWVIPACVVIGVFGHLLWSLAATVSPAPRLIQFGWNLPTPAQLRTGIQAMEARPFDGVVVMLTAAQSPFTRQPIPAADFDQDRANLAATTFTTFTDNFAVMWSGAEAGWRWTNDSDWSAAESNVRQMAQVAQVGGFKGIFFDTEPYGLSDGSWGNNPWLYRAEFYDGLAFEAVAAVVRERGARFMQVLQEEMPQPRLICTWLTLMLLRDSARPDDERTYHLLTPFLEGMLANVTTGQIIDGNEWAYYYTATSEYVQARRDLARGTELLQPAYHESYQAHVGLAQSAYVDSVLNLWNYTPYIGFHLTDPTQRLQLIGFNVYQALTHTDEYAWLYSENVNWWTGDIPPGLEEQVRTAKRLAQTDAPLGYEVESFMTEPRTARDTLTTIWGRITDAEGNGLQNAEISSGIPGLNGADGACAVYNILGDYNCILPRGWSGTITVTLEGRTFDPPLATITDLQEEVGPVSFVGS
jgi:hypothetical protein